MSSEEMRLVWERYARAWSDVGPDERQDLLRETASPACVYIDPVVRCQGHADLAGVMQKFQQTIPGVTIEVVSFSSHHEHALVHCRAVDAGGVTRLPGADAVIFGADGLTAHITGFFETAKAS